MLKRFYYSIFRFFRNGKVSVRKVRHGDSIYLERRRYIFFGLFQIPFLHKRWKPLDNSYIKLYYELNKTTDKLKNLLFQLKENKELFSRERKEMGKSLETEWFDYPLGKSESLKIEKILEEPPLTWMKLINPKFLKNLDRSSNSENECDIDNIRDSMRLDMNISEESKVSEDLPRAARTVYHDEKMSPHAMVLTDLENADGAMAFRKPDNKKGKANERKRRPGETPEEHKIRLAVLDAKGKEEEGTD